MVYDSIRSVNHQGSKFDACCPKIVCSSSQGIRQSIWSWESLGISPPSQGSGAIDRMILLVCLNWFLRMSYSVLKIGLFLTQFDALESSNPSLPLSHLKWWKYFMIAYRNTKLCQRLPCTTVVSSVRHSGSNLDVPFENLFGLQVKSAVEVDGVDVVQE